MEQLNSNIERVIEANTTIEVLNVGAFFALVKAYKYVAINSEVDSMVTAVKVNVPFTYDLYNKDNDKISTGTISPGEKATFKVPTYKMVINNTYDYDVHIVYSFGSGTVSQLKTDLEMTTEDIAALTAYDKQDFDLLTSIDGHLGKSVTALSAIDLLLVNETAIDKRPHLLQKLPIFIALDTATNTYFSVIGLGLSKKGAVPPVHQNYFITHIDIGFDFSTVFKPGASLYITNTFNPAMSYGQYDDLTGGEPASIDDWNARQWTNRANNGLPTRSKTMVIGGSGLRDDGHFRVEINEPYGFGESLTDNFILRTDIDYKAKIGAASKLTSIRTYTDIDTDTPANVHEYVQTGYTDFKKYNRCTNQKPIRTVDSNMVVIDVCTYGYLLP